MIVLKVYVLRMTLRQEKLLNTNKDWKLKKDLKMISI